MMKRFFSFVLMLLCAGACHAQTSPADDFYVKPYLQLGDHGRFTKTEAVELLWALNRNQDRWRVESKDEADAKWHSQPTPNVTVVSTPHRTFLFKAKISGLKPGAPFEYRLLRNSREVFHAKAMSRKGPDQPYRVALFGDMGANTEGQRKVAFQVYDHQPDLVIMLGDIVYDFGRFSEYLEKFFPIYNSDKASPHTGAPLLRSVISLAVLGNHDVALGDNPSGINLDKFVDGLAYYEVWSQPLNGPLIEGLSANVPRLLGAANKVSQYLRATEHKYPRMSNYSFDYGNSHWLVLDANPYMDWTDASLRSWVSKDLAAATQAKWKFVCFHQPGFSFDASHYKEQRMRLLCDIFEKGGVDAVFSGHAHNYQRSFPLAFKIRKENGQPVINPDGTIDGDFTLDKSFDGTNATVPRGIIYVVSGAGGARLYPSAERKDPRAQRIFTNKFIYDTHSFTRCDVSGSAVTISQISQDGKLLDTFTLNKNEGTERVVAQPAGANKAASTSRETTK